MTSIVKRIQCVRAAFVICSDSDICEPSIGTSNMPHLISYYFLDTTKRADCIQVLLLVGSMESVLESQMDLWPNMANFRGWYAIVKFFI